jgi:hypothetical protein
LLRNIKSDTPEHIRQLSQRGCSESASAFGQSLRLPVSSTLAAGWPVLNSLDSFTFLLLLFRAENPIDPRSPNSSDRSDHLPIPRRGFA